MDEPHLYAFLSHTSACEVLRALEAMPVHWPSEPRLLPLTGACVSNQREFKSLAKEEDLARFGVVSSPVDLLVPRQAMRSRGKGAHFHVWSSDVPTNSMLRLSEHVIVSGPELIIVQFCGSLAKLDSLLDEHARAVNEEKDALGLIGLDEPPVVDNPHERDSIERLVAATVLACEFAGSYRLGTASGDTRYHARPLMSKTSLNNVISSLRGTTNKVRATKVSQLFLEASASPAETSLALMLTMPVAFGGMGLPFPELNAIVDVSAHRGQLADRDKVTPDLLWRDERVAVEYDSAEFHESLGGRQLERDARRANTLTACGYRVLRITPDTIRSVADVELLARQLAHLLGVVLERPDDVQRLRRRRLFSMLMR